MKWFKHDTDASNDAKLVKLRMRYGIEGYGLYWYCLELIANSVDENNITFELEHDAEVIGFNINMHFEKVQEIMAYMIELNLFENNTGAVTCLKMALRLDQSMTSNPKMRQIISNFKQNHDPVMTKSCKTRLDKNRLEESKAKTSRFTPPTLEEIKEYVKEKNYKIDEDRFINFYQSKGWMVGKNKMKDWKAAIRNWANSSDNVKDNYGIGGI